MALLTTRQLKELLRTLPQPDVVEVTQRTDGFYQVRPLQSLANYERLMSEMLREQASHELTTMFVPPPEPELSLLVGGPHGGKWVAANGAVTWREKEVVTETMPSGTEFFEVELHEYHRVAMTDNWKGCYIYRHSSVPESGVLRELLEGYNP